MREHAGAPNVEIDYIGTEVLPTITVSIDGVVNKPWIGIAVGHTHQILQCEAGWEEPDQI